MLCFFDELDGYSKTLFSDFFWFWVFIDFEVDGRLLLLEMIEADLLLLLDSLVLNRVITVSILLFKASISSFSLFSKLFFSEIFGALLMLALL